MLLCRSRCSQLILLLVSTVNSQYYNAEYDGEANYEESGKPDYSKYFASDTSAPLLQPSSTGDADPKGFVQPLAFSSFFGTEGFGFGAASNQELIKTPKQPAGFVTPAELSTGFADLKSSAPFGRDYFEDSQRAKEPAASSIPSATAHKEDYELKPGPSYISHKIVAPASTKQVKQTVKYGSEVNDLNRDYDKEYKEYKYKPVKDVVEKAEGGYADGSDVEKKPTIGYGNFDFNKLNLQGLASYQQDNVKFLPVQTTASPYQKYSFQPSSALTDFGAYNLQPSSSSVLAASSDPVVAKLLKQKNCRKVNKEVKGRSKRQAMDCYVCRDERSGANFEQCSYGASSTPKQYYVESSKKYSQPAQYDSYRYKRYAEKEDEKEEDPYEFIKSQTQKYYSKPIDFEKEYLSAKGSSDNEEYRFGPEYFNNDDGEAKSSSEKQSEELVKQGENCSKVQKDGMVCMVCKNKKTGGNYEQCSYSSKPAEKKYAYVNEKKYDSDDDDEAESTEDKPVKEQQVFGKKYSKGEKGRKPDEEEVERVQAKTTKRKHFDEYKKERQTADKPLESPHDDPHYFKHFPEYTKEESKKSERTADPEEYGYYGDGEKKEVEEVLAEFAKKDRSQCKKTEKNGMTCYQCTDKKGLQHEECMFISESQPQSKYAAYHAQQESEDPKREESNLKPTEVPFANTKTSSTAPVAKQSKRILRRTKNVPAVETVEKTQEIPAKKRGIRSSDAPVETYASAKTRNAKQFADDADLPKAQSQRNERKSTNQRAQSNSEYTKPNSEDTSTKSNAEAESDGSSSSAVDEYKADGEDGAFTAETQPVYSKTLGFSVPKYMLVKSEGEKSYDEFVKGA